jgi:hypothetical protein
MCVEKYNISGPTLSDIKWKHQTIGMGTYCFFLTVCTHANSLMLPFYVSLVLHVSCISGLRIQYHGSGGQVRVGTDSNFQLHSS